MPSKPNLGVRPNSSEVLPLEAYDHIIVSFSGGKDSIACLAHILDLGAQREKIQLWHQDIDGGLYFMDWPCTGDFISRVGRELDIKTLFQWREGGFYKEMMRKDEPTAPVTFQHQNRMRETLESKGPKGTRLKFPQVCADLKIRWCSSALKIDVAARAITNTPQFKDATILFLTGERREESSSRARYAEIEKHRTSTKARRVDHWRPVIDWKEDRVWDASKRYGVIAHPAYFLGWSRLSCMSCIFGNPDQWASILDLAPDQFERIARTEEKLGVTIHRKMSVRELADRGKSYIPKGFSSAMRIAMADEIPGNIPICESPDIWTLPLGAFKNTAGPT